MRFLPTFDPLINHVQIIIKIIYLQMQIVMKNSNKKFMVKQRIFIGNWDKNSTHESNNGKCNSVHSNPSLTSM